MKLILSAVLFIASVGAQDRGKLKKQQLELPLFFTFFFNFSNLWCFLGASCSTDVSGYNLPTPPLAPDHYVVPVGEVFEATFAFHSDSCKFSGSFQFLGENEK